MKTSLWKTFSSVADRPIRIKFDTESHAYDDRKEVKIETVGGISI